MDLGHEFMALLLQLSPAVAAKVLEWLKGFEAGPFKALKLPGLKGTAIKWALSILISGVIAALAQVVGLKAGIDAPTITSGIAVGVGMSGAYAIARPKPPKVVS